MNAEPEMYDVVIIGAGVVGAAAARELSKYRLKIALLEKEADVSCGASKANSGIVHGGYDAVPGTLKAKFNVLGSRMYERMNRELNFGYLNTGSLVLAFDEADERKLHELMDRGRQNQVAELELLDRDAVLALEPNVAPNVTAALRCGSAGITSPYEMVIALAENAIANGVELVLNAEVTDITVQDSGLLITTPLQRFQTRYAVNCAGYYSDQIARFVDDTGFTITPKKGQYILLDKTQGKLTNTVLFQTPTEKGKGILVTRTFHGNLMLGPNSEQIQDMSNLGTDEDILTTIAAIARRTLPGINLKKALTSFSGIRAASDRHDFILEPSTATRRLIHAGGIESPGLTASPAIAEKIVELLDAAGLDVKLNPDFTAYRPPIFKAKSKDFKGVIDHEDPGQNIICRCEKVTESEIMDALRRPIPIASLDAIKRRTRAGMGFCQGNFCGPRVKALISRETGIPENQIPKRTETSPAALPKADIKRLFK